MTYRCHNCGRVYTKPSYPLGHDYHEIIAPTCTEKGYTIYKCSNCGETKISDYVNALGHDYTVTKVHQHGAKEGEQLSDYEAGMRSGYLLCQSDHSGLYKYKKALDEGKSKEEARKISRQIGKGKK